MKGSSTKYWVPVAVWMVLIFGFSTGAFAMQTTSRILAPLIHFFFPSLPHETTLKIVFWLRKTAHMAEYAILSILLLRAISKRDILTMTRFPKCEALIAFAIATAYAATDEFHQYLTATRQGSIVDVGIDSLGAMLGLLFVWAVLKIRSPKADAIDTPVCLSKQ